jgi:group I intron endonuclease
MILNKSEVDKVIGEIYKITNTINNKIYIGQTRSHRLNKDKYRPFGYMGRFKDHINECYSKKKNVCNYLNSAILKYGEEKFICEKLIECPVDKLDEAEIKYISEYNSKYPNGYNLTDGGKTCKYCIVDAEESSISYKERPRNFKRNEETKKLISETLKKL